MKIDELAACWKDLSYSAFGEAAKKLGGISSEIINGIIGQLSEAPRDQTEQWIRFIIALHFHLGKRAEFFLNDRSTTTLLSILESNGVAQQQQKASYSSSSAVLVVMLLSLNATTLTVGVENQICATFLSASPTVQKLLLPLVHRSFYQVLRNTSLARQLFDDVIHKQASELVFCPQLRLHALRYARAESIEDLLATILFRVDIAGRKPTLGSAPVAVLPNNSKAKIFSVLCHCDSASENQLHHYYVFSGIREFFRKNRKIKDGCILPQETCEVLVKYIQIVLEQLTSFLSDARKMQMFSTQKCAGQNYVEAVACDVLSVSCSLSAMYSGIGELLTPDVTGFMYLALRLSRSTSSGSGGGSNDSMAAIESIPELLSTGDASAVEITDDSSGTPLLSCSVILQCLEFMIQTSDLHVVKDSLDDLFGERMWSSYLAEDGSFAMQVCLLMLRNRHKLESVLPSYEPRIMWLLSTQPHSLFPIVKRLLPYLCGPATSEDLLCRILFLPLVTFAWDFKVDKREEECSNSSQRIVLSFIEQLWDALNNWEVDPLSPETSLVKHIRRHAHDFSLWDAVHGLIDEFSPRMLTGFRLIRPLLAQFFRVAPVKPETFEVMFVGYFFLVSPAPTGARRSVTDFLLEMGRWISETNPSLAIRSSLVFSALIQQEFLPVACKAPIVQRWACVVFATALTKEQDAESTQKHAASFFEFVHVVLWEMVAVAGTNASSEHIRSSSLSPMVSSSSLRSLHSSSRSCNMKNAYIGNHSRAGRSTGDFAPPCGDFTILNPVVAWNSATSQDVWSATRGNSPSFSVSGASSPTSSSLSGIEFSEHMHSLILSLTMLTRLCPNLRERGSICLANIVRTLSKSATFSNSCLMDTTRFCMKLLKVPPLSGCDTLPLHALLGMNPQ